MLVCHDPAAGARACLRQIGAGLEEEGVPFRVEEGGGSAAELAYAAAQASDLDVGIGIGAAGDVCVHQSKLPRGSPALSGPPETARTMGHNAARLVKGIPFKDHLTAS
ncbi:MAG TPA: glycerol dehydratase reactivase beta/small subunit family protein [Streptosporangiaceae bacterium]|nr:glycerol dehydratase reactivase beta/small subunit family protein [Streptosporangiaceae bacterium]